MKKGIIILVVSLIINCFNAKRSPFDTTTPSGASISFATLLSKLKPISYQTSGSAFLFEKPLFFLAEGTEQTFQLTNLFPGAENYKNFTITPSLPSVVTLTKDGTFICSCPNNTPFQGGEFVLSYTFRDEPTILTTSLKLFVYSPHALLVPTNGIFDFDDFYPVIYDQKLYLFLQNNSSLSLYRWNETSANDWTIVYSNFLSATSPSNSTLRAKVYNNKIYFGFYNNPGTGYYEVYSYNGSSIAHVDSLSCTLCFDAAMEVHNNELYVSYVDDNNYIQKLVNGSFIPVSSLVISYGGDFTSLHSWNGKLWIAYTANIYPSYFFRFTNSDDWSSHIQIDSAGVPFLTPALSTFQNKLYILRVKNTTPANEILLKYTLDGINFQDEFGGNTLGELSGQVKGVSMLSFNNKLLIAYAQNNIVKYRYNSYNSWGWSNDLSMNSGTSSTFIPRLISWNEIPLLAWREDIGISKKIFIKILK